MNVQHDLTTGVSEGSLVQRSIIGHKTDAMFDRYRIVDEREITDAGQRADNYLRTQRAHGDRSSESDSQVPKTVPNSEWEAGGTKGEPCPNQ